MQSKHCHRRLRGLVRPLEGMLRLNSLCRGSRHRHVSDIPTSTYFQVLGPEPSLPDSYAGQTCWHSHELRARQKMYVGGMYGFLWQPRVSACLCEQLEDVTGPPGVGQLRATGMSMSTLSEGYVPPGSFVSCQWWICIACRARPSACCV